MKLDHRISVDNLQLLLDERDPRVTNTANPILTTPYVLLGLEFGWQEGQKYSRYWPNNGDFKTTSRYGVSSSRAALV